MAKVNNKEIYEVKEWLNDTPQNRSGLSALVSGGVTVEQLNVTENGTYAEAGKAYSPVVVNVAGGSSDFSTAEVTFKNTDQTAAYTISGLYCVYENSIGYNTFVVTADVTVKIPMYNDESYIPMSVFSDVDFSVPPVFEGDIALPQDPSDTRLLVSGDGSITLTGIK